jgi:3-deoxy-D-manno-octulosonate 8-phosphate phosphatase (KDO 8-P phosphatase)
MPLSAEALNGRARLLRLLLFDVDGVLTDGMLGVRGSGSETKQFFIRDGAALVWAQRAGVRVGLLSGRSSEATSRRAAELGISIVAQGHSDKRAGYSRILLDQALRDEEVAYMGDDLMDLPVLGRVGLSAAPADAADDVRTRVDWVSRCSGGRGAVREFVELVLRAQGRWDGLVQSFVDSTEAGRP